jgi:hypothetical protein
MGENKILDSNSLIQKKQEKKKKLCTLGEKKILDSNSVFRKKEKDFLGGFKNCTRGFLI